MNDAVQSAKNQGKVLVVDDTKANRDLLRKLLAQEGYAISTAVDGEGALKAVSRESPDVVLLDVIMPGLGGFDVCQRLKQDPQTRLIPIVLVTGLHERQDRIRGISAGADDFLAKPFDPEELKARVRSLVRLKRHTDDLDSAESVIMSLALTIEARDPSTNGHCQRLAGYAVRLGTRLGLGEEELGALHRGGFLHDIGKIAIPDRVLLKPGPLTGAEREVMKRHTTVGDTLCRGMRSLRLVWPIVRHHHERLDGSGYPDALTGDEIPLSAQIVAVVDVYDALTTDRPYRRALAPEDAYDMLREQVARGWHRRDLVEEFITGCRAELAQPARPDAAPGKAA